MLTLSIVTPERKLLEVECESVAVPGSLGELGLLPDHSPLLSSLKTGELTYATGGESHHVVIRGGFVEIADDRVNVLADGAELPGEIDVAAAQAAHVKAEDRLKDVAAEELDAVRNEVDLHLARISVGSHQ